MATFAGNKINKLGSEVLVGQKAPDFTLTNKDLTAVSLSDFGDKIKILTIVPSVDTGVCDAQTRKFNEMYAEQKQVIAITISMDLPFALGRFCGNAGIDNAITLSDYQTGAFGESYGVLMEGIRLLQRAVVILNQNNDVVYTEYMEESADAVDFDKAAAVVAGLL